MKYLFIATLLAASLPAAASAGTPAQSLTALFKGTVTPQQCLSAFNGSSAARSCSNTRMEVWGDRTSCTVHTDCLRNNGNRIGNVRTGPLSQMARFRNCDGMLC